MSLAWGQNVEFKSSNFKDDKEGLKIAKENIDLGDEAYELGTKPYLTPSHSGSLLKPQSNTIWSLKTSIRTTHNFALNLV